MNRNLCVDTTWLARAVLSSLGLLPITAGGCSGQTVDRSAGTTGGTDATVPCDRPERLATGLERCGAGGPVHRNATEVCSAKDLSGVMLGCLTDADCDAGKLCRCGTSGGVCFPADCRTDADCGANLRCQMFDHDICSSQFFTCQTADDTCETDADCVGTVLGGGGSVGIMLTQHCDSRGGPFRCEPSGCTVGRPFLVEGRERLAPAAVRSDWLADLPSDVEQLPEEIRALAAAGWVAIARMEHASVAAFARFALQLLELGAPPWLIERATSAMADETRHAKLAFALGSKLAGQPVGPGPLAMDGSMVSLTLPEVVCLVFREGCVGETGAALEARLASTHVAQPGLEQLLLGIADDETRHAQLAWQFVGWALTVDPRGAGEALRRELERAKCEVVVANSDEPHAPALKRFGLVSAAERAELRHQVLRDVVVPCTERLLAGLRPEAPSRSPSAGAP